MLLFIIQPFACVYFPIHFELIHFPCFSLSYLAISRLTDRQRERDRDSDSDSDREEEKTPRHKTNMSGKVFLASIFFIFF